MKREVQIRPIHRINTDTIEKSILKHESYQFDLIKQAFYKYAECHKAPLAMTNLEFERFSKILRRMKK